jgi:arylsulfatase
MQVYAAMIDIMDQGIGRIITALEKKGILENTVIFYLHDNGGCAETLNSNENEIAPITAQQQLKNYSADSAFLGKQPIYTRSGHFIRSGKGVMPGPDSSWVTYGEEWANVSNTPFRSYKHWTHEGGIATPLIIHWPKGITAKGQLRTQPGHLIDIMATCLAITGVNYPNQYKGNEIQPYEGVSLLPAFANKNLKREELFWEHEGNRALRVGNWKIVSRVQKNKVFTPSDETAWELYDLEKDPTETSNLALRFPEKVKSLAAKWEQEAVRVKAKPWPWEPSN